MTNECPICEAEYVTENLYIESYYTERVVEIDVKCAICGASFHQDWQDIPTEPLLANNMQTLRDIKRLVGNVNTDDEVKEIRAKLRELIHLGSG